jgi:hypothetical protein
MALPSSPSDASPLLGYLNTVYPLACLLVGPDQAPHLLIRVYQRAAEHPPEQRPEDTEKWLLDLLREMGELSSGDRETVAAADEAAPGDDPLRQDVAGDLIEHALPVALAACSPQERFLLALDAFEAAGEDSTEVATDSVTDAYATLQTKLQGVLSPIEYNLVDEALSPTSLRDAVREWVTTQFSPAPSSLRARIRTTLQTTTPAEESTSIDSEESSQTQAAASGSVLPARLSPRALLLTLLIGTLVVAGGIGVTYVMQSSSAPSATQSTSLVAFSTERAFSVTPELRTSSRSEAEAYVRSTWRRQIQIPRIRGTQLQGVGRVRTNDVEIPVLLYADTDDSTRIATFAYNYALVNQLGATATLNPRLRRELARPGQLVAQAEASSEGLLWRDRDDIYVAVAPSIATDSLRARLQP